MTVAASSFPIAAGGDNDSSAPVISGDGRYVLFASAANNLVLYAGSNALPALSPPRQNVFLRDRTNGTTTLVSVNLSAFGGGNADSMPTGISTNGQYALFESTSTNLVAGVTNGFNHVFLRDVVNNTTVLVDFNPVGYTDTHNSVMTPDGRYAAYASAIVNLGITDIFVRDTQSNVTTQVTSARPGGVNEGGSSDLPDLTPDGHYVAFYSAVTNLVSGVTTAPEIYIRDLVGGTTLQASAYAHTAVSAIYGTTNVVSYSHCLSDDGQSLAYEAANYSSMTNGVILHYNVGTGLTDLVATNAVGAPVGTQLTAHNLDLSSNGRFVAFVAYTNTSTCVFVWDSQSGGATLASGDTNNSVPAGSTCSSPVLDASGRYVSFIFTGSVSLTSNAVAAGPHLYVRDLQAGITSLVDADTNGIGSITNLVTFPRINESGNAIAYEAYGGALVANGANPYQDVFVYSITNGSNELISARQPGLPSASLFGPNLFSTHAISANGRYVAFSSQATNVTPNDTNNFRDVFVRDLLGGSNIPVSVGTNGTLSGNGFSQDPAISGDGRYVVFMSTASNLVAGDTNIFPDVFVRDLQLGTTTLVSVNTSGTGPGNAASYSPLISTNGRYVLFRSLADNLAPGITSTNFENIYRRDLQAGSTWAFTTNGLGSLAAIAMTPDGRFVAVGGADVGSTAEKLYVWDMQTTNRIYTNNATIVTYLGISPDGTHLGYFGYATGSNVIAANLTSNTLVTLGSKPASPASSTIQFSADSRYMVYENASASLTNQVYVYDFQTGSNVLVSQNLALTGGGNGNSDSPAISADGRFVAYRSAANNLVAGVSNGLPNVYLFDRSSGVTTLATMSEFGNFAANGRSLGPVFSGDSQTLFLASWASDLAPRDYNHWGDLFALGLYSQPAFMIQIAVPAAGQPPTLNWPVIPGLTYQLQYKTNLTDANWTVLTGNVTIIGSQSFLTDPSATTQRYYRIVAW